MLHERLGRDTGLVWLGHATFLLETSGGKRVLIDPWIQGNPACPESWKSPGGADLILVTHGHFDHAGEVPEMAKATSAKHVVCNPETVAWFEKRGYRHRTFCESLIVELDANPKLAGDRVEHALARVADYELRAIESERDRAALAVIEERHGSAWAREVKRAAAPPSGAFTAWKDGHLVSFAAIDGNNRGLGHFGPAATITYHRGRGLGAGG